MRKLLVIGTDRLLFKEGSAVRERIKGYAKDWDEMHIIIATTGSEFSETSIAPNVWVYPTRSKIKALYPLDAARIGRFIVKGRGITNITCQDPFLTAIAGTRLKKESGLPLELQVHTDIGSPNFTYSLRNKIYKALALSYLPKADHIRVVSNRVKDYLTDKLGIGASKIEVRPIMVDIEAIKNTRVEPSEGLHRKYSQFKKIALVASRLEPEKNVKLVIEAWREVVKKMPEAGLVVCGSGSQLERLKKLAGQNVVFESWVDRKALYAYYKTADLFLSTSLFEGYGMALVEAAAAGCPIVSTDVGVAREVGATIIPFDARETAEIICAKLLS